VATGSSDLTVCVVNIETGKSLARSGKLEANIIEVAFSNQQQPILVAGDHGGAIYIFNWNQMKLLDKIKVASVRFRMRFDSKMGISKIIY
jgi:WD40 repeat protein